jgi:hypothetical protein
VTQQIREKSAVAQLVVVGVRRTPWRPPADARPRIGPPDLVAGAPRSSDGSSEAEQERCPPAPAIPAATAEVSWTDQAPTSEASVGGARRSLRAGGGCAG